MNKSEQREVLKLIDWSANLGGDWAARGISALIRSSMRNKAKEQMLAIAQAHGWDKSADFII